MGREAAHKNYRADHVLIVPKGTAGWAKTAEDQDIDAQQRASMFNRRFSLRTKECPIQRKAKRLLLYGENQMNKSLTILAMLAALITMGTAANALPLAAAGYGGNTQNTADCILYNAGSSKVSVSGAKIAGTFNGSLPLTFNNCASLAPGAFCTIQANIVNNNISHACNVDVSSILGIRGALLIRHVDPKFSVDQVLTEVPLR